MRRLALITLTTVLAILSPLAAHFVYVVPDSATTAKVIFSDTLLPDEKVAIEKIATTKLMLAVDGQIKPIEWTLKKDAAHYAVEVPGTGTRVVLANTDYGVLQRGNNMPFRLQYHAKAIMGPILAPEKLSFPKELTLELVPQMVDGKIQFSARLAGKPLVKAEFAVLAPEAESSSTQLTDDQGLTAGFDKPGTYAARVLHIEKKPGEYQGKPYNEVRHYATCVVELPAPSK